MPPSAIKSINIEPYTRDRLADTVAFFQKTSPDHPELANPALIEWQRSERFLALFQNRIVGHIARIPQAFCRGEQTIDLGWAATLVLDTSLPMVQVFAGTALLDRVTEEGRYRFAAVGVVPEIEVTHQRRGFVVNRTAVRMYARFLNAGAMLRYMGRSAVYAPPIHILNAVRPVRRAKSQPASISEISEFDRQWDGLWASCLGGSGTLHGARTAEYLNYKLRQPGKPYQTFLWRDAAGAPGGYVILRRAVNKIKNLSLAKIVDLTGTETARAALIERAMAWALAADVDGVVALDAAADKSLYAAAGLWASRAFPVVIPPDLDGLIRVTFLDSDLDDLW